MAGNKVKYSDLIQDDGALDRLLDKLEQTATTFEGLVSTAKSSARDISNSLNSMSSATQAGRDSILAANAAVANLKSATAQLKVSISDTSQAVTGLKAAISENTTVTAKSYSAIEQAIGKYDKLKSDLQDYMNLYKSLTTQEKSSPFGQQTLEEITKLASRVNTLTANLRALTKTQKERLSIGEQETNSLRKLADAQSDANVKRYENNQALREANRIAALNAKLRNAEPGSYQAISAQYALNKIELSKLNVESERASERTKRLVADTYLLYQQMKQFQEATGVHTLSVGNYTKVWDGLGYSVAQVVREIPNAAMGMRTFFIAISNNLPILADQIMQVRKENEALRAQGKPTVSAIKQVGRALMSWNTILTVALTVLNLFGDEIIKWVGSLFKGEAAVMSMRKALRNLNKELENSNAGYGDNMASFKKLQNQWAALTTEAEKAEWVKNHEEAFEDLSLAINDVASAEQVLVNQADAVEETFRRRAEAAAATTLATEEYEKALVATAKAEQKRKEAAEKAANKLVKQEEVMEAKRKSAAEKVGVEYVPRAKGYDYYYDYFYKLFGTEEGVIGSDRRAIKRLIAEAETAEANAEQYLKLGMTYDDLLDDDKKGGGSSRDPEGRDLTDRIYQARLQASKKYAKSETELIKNDYEKRRAEAKASTDAEIKTLEEANRKAMDWLQDNGDKYKELTDEQKQALEDTIIKNNAAIVNAEEKLANDLYQIELDSQINTIKVEKETNDLRLQAVKKGSDKEYILRKQAIVKQRDLAILENKKLKGTGKEQDESVIRAAYNQQLTDVDNEKKINRANEDMADIELQLQAVKKGADKEYALRKQLLEKKRDFEITQNRLLAKELQKSEADIRASYQKQLDELAAEEELGKLNRAKQRTELELQVSKKGSDARLAQEMRLLDEEEKIQLAQNEQLADNLKQEEDLIKASYERRRALLRGQYAMEAFMAQQSEDRAKLASGDVKSYRKNSRVNGRSRRTKSDGSTKYSRVSDYNMQVFETEQAIDALNKQIELATKQEPELDWSADEIAAARAEVAKLKNELDGMTSFWQLSAEKGIGGGILTKLGFDDEEIEAFQNAGNIIMEQINAIADAYIEAAEREVEATKERVAAAQSAYDAEIEARNNGYANNVATAKAELQLEKRTQREKQKELEKAQKAQEAINTVTQISSLVTATAQLWASFASTGIAAPVLAAAAITAMWGSFAFAKIKAAQIAKKSDTYGEGGLEFLQGGSHASGNDIDLGVTNSRGNRMRAEGGEAMAIINKKNTRKYKSILPGLIDSLNTGNFEDKYLSSLNTSGIALSINNPGMDLSKIENSVDDIKRQNETKYYSQDGYLIIQRKNVRRIIKN